MSKFLVKKHLSLAFLGEGWEQCYIDATPLAPNELETVLSKPEADPSQTQTAKAKASLAEGLDLLKRHFVGGKGWNGTEIVPLTAEDLADLPMEVMSRLTPVVMGEVSPNSATPSTN